MSLSVEQIIEKVRMKNNINDFNHISNNINNNIIRRKINKQENKSISNENQNNGNNLFNSLYLDNYQLSREIQKLLTVLNKKSKKVIKQAKQVQSINQFKDNLKQIVIKNQKLQRELDKQRSKSMRLKQIIQNERKEEIKRLIVNVNMNTNQKQQKHEQNNKTFICSECQSCDKHQQQQDLSMDRNQINGMNYDEQIGRKQQNIQKLQELIKNQQKLLTIYQQQEQLCMQKQKLTTTNRTTNNIKTNEPQRTISKLNIHDIEGKIVNVNRTKTKRAGEVSVGNHNQPPQHQSKTLKRSPAKHYERVEETSEFMINPHEDYDNLPSNGAGLIVKVKKARK